MYNFIDVNEASEGYVLPSEALQINGEYIENLIPGYRTLNVKGREALSPDIVSYSTGVRDGSKLQSKRYPERIITVTYQLVSASNEDFRAAYNKLGAILDVEDAELIFNDEQDKYYVGTPCIIGEVEPGRNAVVGTIEILCTDPFKYSVLEYEAAPSADDGTILIDYNGTYKSFPILQADFYKEEEVAADGETAKALTGNGDCGFVAFFNEAEKIIQLGDPDEADKEGAFAKAQTLMNQTFMGSTAWGTTAKALWAVNKGNVIPSTIKQMGSVGMNALPTASIPETSGQLLEKTSTAESPAIKYVVKAKATGRTADAVKVDITITASMTHKDHVWKNAGVLIASVKIDSYWHDVTIKSASDRWSSTTAHTKNLTVTVTGLSASDTLIKNIKFKAYRSDNLGKSGILAETACNNLTISAYTESGDNGYYLKAASYGAVTGNWHGPSITRQFGADAAGEVGAKNFTLTYKQRMSMSNSPNAQRELGSFQMQLADINGAIVAGIRIAKSGVGKAGTMSFYVNGKWVNSTPIDLYYNNYYFGAGEKSVQTTKVTKVGNTITFAVGGYKRQYVNDDVADMAVTQVTFMFEQYSASPVLAYNGLYWAKFVKNNCDTYKDIPNKFSANDVVEADCANGEILLNGVSSPELGALGNDWEGFYLTPGLNQIGYAYSSWVDSQYAPGLKVRYREVFL